METLQTKYNRPLPRYTSYPPATFFHNHFTARDFRKELIASNEEQPKHISIYIHVPFCPQLCHYCGCNALEMSGTKQVKAYAEALKKEMQLIFPLLSDSRKISQIHFGGGTPTTLPVDSIREITGFIRNSFDSIEQPEIAMECHPAYLNDKMLTCLKEVGFNRISLGIQDFDTEVLKIVNRLPSRMPIQELVTFIHQEMKASVNFDFIYGLPKQSPESFLASLHRAVSLAPDRIVTFPYSHLPQLFKRQQALEQAGLPSIESKQSMFDLTSDYLKGNHYFQVGMDHFVLENDKLWTAAKEKQLHRNFQGYCSRKTTGQVYAFGVSGISQLASCYAQNTKDLTHYITSVEKGELPIEKGYQLNNQERIARDIINSLMCNYVAKIDDKTWRNDSLLEAMQQDGIIEISQNHIQLTTLGKPFVRNVAACFDISI